MTTYAAGSAVKELRLAGVSEIQAGNAFLPRLLERFNDRFAVEGTGPERHG